MSNITSESTLDPKSLNPELSPRVNIPSSWVLGFWVIVTGVQVLGKYTIIRYLDPQSILVPEYLRSRLDFPKTPLRCCFGRLCTQPTFALGFRVYPKGPRTQITGF